MKCCKKWTLAYGAWWVHVRRITTSADPGPGWDPADLCCGKAICCLLGLRPHGHWSWNNEAWCKFGKMSICLGAVRNVSFSKPMKKINPLQVGALQSREETSSWMHSLVKKSHFPPEASHRSCKAWDNQSLADCNRQICWDLKNNKCTVEEKEGFGGQLKFAGS